MTSATSRRWLFGPVPDLMLGCGVAWMVAFAFQGAVGGEQLSAWVPAGILVMVSSIPHYGATLLRVYESGDDRRKYSLLAIHATAALALLFVVGLHHALLGSLVLTLYLTWSPWHYTGQNYGITLMLMGRRGVTVTPVAKRWLHASFVISYVMVLLSMHGAGPSQETYAPVTVSGVAFQNLSLGIPAALNEVLIPLATAGYLVSLVMAAISLRGSGRPSAWLPGTTLVATQSLWFAVPVVARHFGWVDHASFLGNVFTPYGFIWIATAHAVQYLWITSYFARTSGRARGLAGYLGKAVLAGYAVWTLPALLLAPNLLGAVGGGVPPYESGLALMAAAVVNLHHFVLDGAIWKLRDGRIARVLLRNAGQVPEPVTPTGPRWGRVAFGVAGALAVGISLVALYEDMVGQAGALQSGNVSRLRQTARHLEWIGRDGPRIHVEIGRLLAQRGQWEAASEAYRHSLELYPTAGAWLELAFVEESRGDLEEALRCREAVLEMDPNHLQALYEAGRTQLLLGQAGRAVTYLERALALDPDRGMASAQLERARRELARGDPIPGG